MGRVRAGAIRCAALVLIAILLGSACGRKPPASAPPPASPSGSPAPAEPAPPRVVLRSWLAGTWYPAGSNELARTLAACLADAAPVDLEQVHALILPHAGYRFSGRTAAVGIKALRDRTYRRVLILGPSHRVAMRNVASLPQATHVATPLGEIPLDTGFMRTLLTYDHFRTVPEAHVREHSVQIEVPFLQAALGSVPLVPIVVGQLDLETARAMARVLLGLIDADTLVIASSDFTHFGPNYGYEPFHDRVEQNIRALDMGGFDFIKRKDPAGFMAYCEKTGATFCGRHPITVLLAMLDDSHTARLLKYDTSGRITGDFKNSVSYLSIAFEGSWDPRDPEPRGGALSATDRAQLLKLARRTLAAYYEHGRPPRIEELDIEITPAMRQVQGAFVTLNKDDRLRGCVGTVTPIQPLYRSVMENAVNAAIRDVRFRPVQKQDLEDLSIEISALTPPQVVANADDIVLGRHGIVLSKHQRGAVYLPQVAPSQNWTLDETLSHLSRKAGLEENAWKTGAVFHVFEAIVFSEERP